MDSQLRLDSFHMLQKQFVCDILGHDMVQAGCVIRAQDSRPAASEQGQPILRRLSILCESIEAP